MDDLVKARCGKMVKATQLEKHERLCSACGGHSPLDAVNAATQEERAARIEATQAGPGPALVDGGDTPAGTEATSPQPPATPPDPIVEKVADKVLGVLSPAMKQRFDEIFQAIGNIKPPSKEEIEKIVDARVNAVLEPLVQAKEGAAAGGDGNGAGAGAGGLGSLIGQLLPLLKPQAAPGAGLAGTFDQLKGLAEAAKALSDVFSRPYYDGVEQGARMASSLLTFTAKNSGDVGAAAEKIAGSFHHEPPAAKPAETPKP